jgi:large subunit ribosomal protein L21
MYRAASPYGELDRGGNIFMYAIFETGGKQHKVAAGDVVRVEKLPGTEEGKKVKFDKVLAINDGKETHIGTPYLDAATVDATVTAVGKGDKVIVFKFKAKKGYRRKQGHRQPFTEVEIESVSLGGKTVFKMDAPKQTDKPASKEKDDDGESGKPDDVKDVKDEAPVSDADVKEEASVSDAGDADKTVDETPAEAATDDTSVESEDKESAPENDETVDAERQDSESETGETAEAEGKEDATAEPEAEQPENPDADSADSPEAVEDKPAAKTSSKMTKADIMAKLDELGASYAKNAKKDELLAILAEAEK